MKTSKHLFLLFVIPLMVSCSSQKIQTPEPTITAPAQTTPFLDFDHPRLHEIANGKPLVIREIARTRRYADGVPYVAIIIDTGDAVLKLKMLIFRLEKPTTTLIYESDPYYYMSFNIVAVDPSWLIENSNYYYYSNIEDGIAQFGSDYLEVPVNVSYGGNCYDCTWMKIIGIKEDGTIKDITPESDFAPKTFINPGKNLVLPFYIIATRYYEFDYGACSHTASPFAFRLFKWQDSAYVDVSKDEKEFYDQKISELISDLQEYYGKPLNSCWVMPTLANIFFDYESSGRVEYGWEQVKTLGDLSHWDIQNTPPEEMQTYQDVFSQLEQRKNQDLASVAP